MFRLPDADSEGDARVLRQARRSKLCGEPFLMEAWGCASRKQRLMQYRPIDSLAKRGRVMDVETTIIVGIVGGAAIALALVFVENGVHKASAVALVLIAACGVLAIPYEEHGGGPVGESQTGLSAGSALVTHAPGVIAFGVLGAAIGGGIAYLIRKSS
jgi:hypothetical protein